MTQMRVRAVVATVSAAAAVLLAGCSAPAAAPPVPATTAAAPTSAPVPAPGSVDVAGAVKAPTTQTAQTIAALPQHTVSVTFGSSGGQQQKSETGVLLSDMLPVAALATTSAKNDQLNFAVLAVGADGYTALVSYGEVSPDFGNRGILVATSEDGAALARPRLVVPGDVKGGRYVSDLVRLQVVRVAQ